MHMLRIEHGVNDYHSWKRVFDDDPIARKASGVRHHKVLRSVDDPNFVIIDLEFATADDATAMLHKVRALWGNVQGSLIEAPRAQIAECVEVENYID